MNQKRIGVIVGSLRRDSYSRAIARTISDLMPGDFKMENISIDDLPIFNQDFDDDGNTPETWQTFRNSVKTLDGFLFVTPEYNRSYPAVIKNALDIGSRPHGQNLWSGKPGAIISVSPGKLGGFGSNHHLRQVMMLLNVYIMQQPEAYIGNVEEILGENGTVKPERLASLQRIADAFASWVNLLTKTD